MKQILEHRNSGPSARPSGCVDAQQSGSLGRSPAQYIPNAATAPAAWRCSPRSSAPHRLSRFNNQRRSVSRYYFLDADQNRENGFGSNAVQIEIPRPRRNSGQKRDRGTLARPTDERRSGRILNTIILAPFLSSLAHP